MKTIFRVHVLILVGWLSLGTTGMLAAQEEPVEGDVAPAPAVGRMVIASATGDGEVSEVQFFSADVAGGAFVMGDGMMLAPDIFALAGNDSVQKEIELVDEQLEQIKQINSDFSKKISEQFRELNKDGMNADRGRELGELIQRLNEEKKSQMQNVLLPHQFDRLRQIALQMQMKHNGDASTLASEQIREELGISEEQKRQLEERAAEIKKDLEAKIAELREKARNDLLQVLSREQRSKLEEMTGAKFEVQAPDFRNRIKQARQARERRDNDPDSSDDN